MFAHTHHHLEHWQVQLQIQLRLHRHTAVRTLATQKMWQPIEHLAISGASHATSWCHGHHRADLRCCSDQAFRECKHQRAKPARGRAASRGCCFAPHLFLRAWRWRERHDGRPQRVPYYAAAAGDEQADLGVARVGFSELQSLEQQQRLPLAPPRSPSAARALRGGCDGGNGSS